MGARLSYAAPSLRLTCQEAVQCAAFSEDGAIVVTSSRDGLVTVYDSGSGESILQFQGSRFVNALDVVPSSDGRLRVLMASSRTLTLWDGLTGQPLASVKPGCLIWTFALLYTDSGDTSILVAGEGKLERWQLTQRRIMKRQSTFVAGHDASYICVSASSESQLALLGCYRGSPPEVWNLRDGKRLHILGDDIGSVNAIVFLHADCAMSCSEDNTLRKWDIKAGVCTKVQKLDFRALCMCSLADSQHVIVGGTHGVLAQYNAKTMKCVRRFQGHRRITAVVTYNPFTRRLLSTGVDATVDDKTVLVFQLDDQPSAHAILQANLLLDLASNHFSHPLFAILPLMDMVFQYLSCAHSRATSIKKGT